VKYLSLFSGIEAASLAWEPLGWEPLAFAEIEPFPSTVLAERWPDVPNLGDILAVDWENWMADYGRPDVIIAGSPCQAFSVAGNRLSLEDARGNLSLFTAELVRLINPRVFLWENVPGALSTKDNAFGCFVGELVGAGEPLHPTGKRWTNAGLVSGPEARLAWRVLDAQHFGVPQRRKRLFAARCPRDGSDPAEVLLERESLFGDLAPSREARTRAPGGPESGSRGGNLLADTGLVRGLKARFGTSGSDLDDAEAGHLIPGMPQRQRIRSTNETEGNANAGGQVAIGFYSTGGTHGVSAVDDGSPAVKVGSGLDIPSPPAVCFKPSHYTRGKDGAPSEICPPLTKEADKGDQDPLLLAYRKSQRAHSAEDCETWTDDGVANTLNAYENHNDERTTHAVIFTQNQREEVRDLGDCAGSVQADAGAHQTNYVAQIFTSDGEVADPVAANEQRTYTNEGGHNFRMHNVVGEEPTVLEVRGREDGRRLETRQDGTANCLRQSNGGRDGMGVGAIHHGMAVRRLTPIECERLQGMPDNHTRVAWRGKEWEDCPDGPRYKAIGNSMAVPVINWLGRQIGSALREEG